jgi:tetratricopeptide (TPR) repeat protein
MRYVIAAALMASALGAPRRVSAQWESSVAERIDSSGAVLVSRAERAAAARRWNEAAELYQRVIAARDEQPERWWALAHALFNARRHREAIGAFERALQLGAGEPAGGAWQIARSYAHRGNRKQALRWLARAVELGFDAREAIRREPLFEQYRSDPRFSVLADPAGAPTRSSPRFPAARTRRAPVGKAHAVQLATAHPLDSRDEAVGAGASIDHPLWKVVGEILESHFVARRANGAELRGSLAGRCSGEDQGVGARNDARVLEVDD